MIGVLGASGDVGSAVIHVLRDDGVAVLAVVHSKDQVDAWERQDVTAREVDVLDTDALRETFKGLTRVFALNPPASTDTDTNAVETATAKSIAAAIQNSGLEKTVVASTYGGQPDDGVGDLSVLYAFEAMIEATGVPTAINRGAYYFTNLDPLIGMAREGSISTPFPANLKMPMVSPADLGEAAATRLTSPTNDIGVRYIEGPKHVTFDEVAEELERVLGRAVSVISTARCEIENSFRKLGFSRAAATSYARMTMASIDHMELPSDSV
jgi:uncharacterized protein YbjT (DUF2867 family)